MDNRFTSETPKWFQNIRNIGMLVVGISTSLLTAPIVLPPLVVTILSASVVAGTVAAGVAQSAKKGE